MYDKNAFKNMIIHIPAILFRLQCDDHILDWLAVYWMRWQVNAINSPSYLYPKIMPVMTSTNGDIFLVSGLLCWEFDRDFDYSLILI